MQFKSLICVDVIGLWVTGSLRLKRGLVKSATSLLKVAVPVYALSGFVI